MRYPDIDPLVALNAVADASTLAIDELKASISRTILRQAVRMIGAAKSIHVAGGTKTLPVASYLREGLTRLGLRCPPVPRPDNPDVYRIPGLTPGDVLVAIGPGDRLCALTDIARIARKHQARVLGITNSTANTLAGHCDLCLVVPDFNRYRPQPLAPHFVLVQCLLSGLDEVRMHEMVGSKGPRTHSSSA